MPYDATPQAVRRNYVLSSARVRIQRPIDYKLFAVPEFPLALLRNKPIEAIREQKFRDGRKLLLEDIRERGMLNPLIVWNHKRPAHPQWKHYPLPWYLKLGLNRRWCLEELGYTHAPAIVTTDGAAPPFDEWYRLETAGDILDWWRDGVFVAISQGPTGKGKSALDKYEFPEFDARLAQKCVTRAHTWAERELIAEAQAADRRLYIGRTEQRQ